MEDEKAKGVVLSDQITALGYVDDLEGLLCELEKLTDAWEENAEKYVAVTDYLADIKEYEDTIKGYKKIVDLIPDVEGLLDCCASYNRSKEKISAVNSIVTGLIETTAQIYTEDNWLLVENDYNDVVRRINAHYQKGVNTYQIGELLKNLEIIDGKIIDIADTMEMKTDRYDKLLKKAGICPLCGAKIK